VVGPGVAGRRGPEHVPHRTCSYRAIERWVTAQRLAWHARLEALADLTPSVLPEQLTVTLPDGTMMCHGPPRARAG
jgi:hypothetical protein